MVKISSRKEVNTILQQLREIMATSEKEFISALQRLVLDHKISFPLLEHLAEDLRQHLPLDKQMPVAAQIMDLEGMGRFVIAGHILRHRLRTDFFGTITSALGFIRKGNEWRACDIIGERVIGNALLEYPEETLGFMKAIISSPLDWDLRAIGVGIHYAVKKGLDKNYSEQSFHILLSLASSKELHPKRSIGWAAKTIAKLHPEIVRLQIGQINDPALIRPWFRTKIQTGLAIAGSN